MKKNDFLYKKRLINLSYFVNKTVYIFMQTQIYHFRVENKLSINEKIEMISS